MSAVDVAIEALNGILPGFACRRLEDGRDALELGGIRIPIEGIAQHVVDDLTGSGYAVIELPEPNSTSDDRYTAGWDVLGDPDSVRLDCFGQVVDADGATYSPDEAREVAAALLSAANRAEAEA